MPENKLFSASIKKGCGTCYAQDTALEETGITENKNVVFLKVERKNKAHNKTYSKYGLSQRQWAALILADRGRSIQELIQEILTKKNHNPCKKSNLSRSRDAHNI